MDGKISKFVRKHLELLLLEREENLQNFFKDLSPASLHRLERTGQALTKLSITNLASKGPGRFQIDLERADGLPLEHGLCNGDLVICIRSKEKGQTIRAIVNEIGESTLSISTNDDYENIREEEIFTVVKTDSDFTYKSQTRALSFLEKKELHSSSCLEIVRILFDTDKEIVQNLLTSEDPIPKNTLDDQGSINFYNPNLAKDQKSAVEFALKRRYFAIIQGPPGTGKTTTLIEIIVQLQKFGKKVLICAPTNVAVDNLVIRLGQTEAKPLRLGHPTRIAKEALKYSLDSYLERDDGFIILKDIKKSIKDLETNIGNSGTKYAYKEVRELKKEYRKRLIRLTCDTLKKCSVILCTLNSASANDGQLQYIPRDHFDVLIVDEASQAMEASTWIAIPNAPKLILAGDINQLPPVVMCQEATKGGLNISLMERAIKKLNTDCYVRLMRQYRMNEKIMTWSSKKFYDDTLEADDLVKNHLLKHLPSVKQEDDLTSEAVVYIDTCGCECEEFNTGVEKASKGNLGEAVIVDKVVTNLVKVGLYHKDIGAITPYALQVDFIRRSFAAKSLNVEVSTVDGFQGREKEVIILSLVRSNEDKELGFVTDFRRLNVAVTRARRSLIVIADSETMEKDDLIVSLLKHIEDNGLLQTAEEYLSETIEKEIERIEITPQTNFKSKKKPKTKTKSSKREKGDEPEVPISKDQLKPNQIIPSKSVIKRKSKGTALSACANLKQYNVYETIAGTLSDNEDKDEVTSEQKEEENVDNKETPKMEQNLEHSDIDISAHSRKKEQLMRNKEEREDKSNENAAKENDNFDKIVQEFNKSNSLCSFDGCKKSTKLIKLICEFCKKWYCLEHGLQEIHGCGNAIRRKEQHAFRHRKPETSTKREKDRFARKLKELEEARKPKKKVTKK
ncbi:immunoglobulin mu binding protein 2 [Nasonia vitripennis]|uniref:AN1-type domain-containing protein n=1 Tax=Nasonia vitripennis TaxID=7425 RepID=A0A7M6UNM4_NASVI|nr:immunoglobulin mu binding protein 2 [Nasonia vitripennis]